MENIDDGMEMDFPNFVVYLGDLSLQKKKYHANSEYVGYKIKNEKEYHKKGKLMDA